MTTLEARIIGAMLKANAEAAEERDKQVAELAQLDADHPEIVKSLKSLKV